MFRRHIGRFVVALPIGTTAARRYYRNDDQQHGATDHPRSDGWQYGDSWEASGWGGGRGLASSSFSPSGVNRNRNSWEPQQSNEQRTTGWEQQREGYGGGWGGQAYHDRRQAGRGSSRPKRSTSSGRPPQQHFGGGRSSQQNKYHRSAEHQDYHHHRAGHRGQQPAPQTRHMDRGNAHSEGVAAVNRRLYTAENAWDESPVGTLSSNKSGGRESSASWGSQATTSSSVQWQPPPSSSSAPPPELPVVSPSSVDVRLGVSLDVEFLKKDRRITARSVAFVPLPLMRSKDDSGSPLSSEAFQTANVRHREEVVLPPFSTLPSPPRSVLRTTAAEGSATTPMKIQNPLVIQLSADCVLCNADRLPCGYLIADMLYTEMNTTTSSPVQHRSYRRPPRWQHLLLTLDPYEVPNMAKWGRLLQECCCCDSGPAAGAPADSTTNTVAAGDGGGGNGETVSAERISEAYNAVSRLRMILDGWHTADEENGGGFQHFGRKRKYAFLDVLTAYLQGLESKGGDRSALLASENFPFATPLEFVEAATHTVAGALRALDRKLLKGNAQRLCPTRFLLTENCTKATAEGQKEASGGASSTNTGGARGNETLMNAHVEIYESLEAFSVRLEEVLAAYQLWPSTTTPTAAIKPTTAATGTGGSSSELLATSQHGEQHPYFNLNYPTTFYAYGDQDKLVLQATLPPRTATESGEGRSRVIRRGKSPGAVVADDSTTNDADKTSPAARESVGEEKVEEEEPVVEPRLRLVSNTANNSRLPLLNVVDFSQQKRFRDLLGDRSYHFGRTPKLVQAIKALAVKEHSELACHFLSIASSSVATAHHGEGFDHRKRNALRGQKSVYHTLLVPKFLLSDDEQKKETARATTGTNTFAPECNSSSSPATPLPQTDTHNPLWDAAALSVLVAELTPNDLGMALHLHVGQHAPRPGGGFPAGNMKGEGDNDRW